MRKFIIFSPHYDDEFIGCHHIISKHPEKIKSIVYFTDSHIQSVFMEPTNYISYEEIRDLESLEYILSYAKTNIDRYHWSFPDGLSLEEYLRIWITSKEEYEKYLIEQIKDLDIHPSDIIVLPTIDSDHKSHIWCNSVAKMIAKSFECDTIEYQCHQLITDKYSKPKHINKKTKNIVQISYNAYYKQEIFVKYFISQAVRFEEQNLIIDCYERYYSEIEDFHDILRSD